MASPTGTTLILKKQRLLAAAETGNLRHLKNLAAALDDGKGMARTLAGIADSTGQSVLHLAALHGHVHICEYLIDELKLEVDSKDAKGETALLLACLGGNLSTAVYLLENGANPDTTDDKDTVPLHYAADIGHKELLRLLLSKRVNVDAISSVGTPLERAAGEGRHEAVKILLDHHANPNLSFHPAYTPLLTSIAANSLECLELLLEAGVDPDAAAFGLPPLTVAASNGESDMVRCLLNAGANPNVISMSGATPIEDAALSNDLQCVQILFPVTSPIPTYLDWSPSGIMRHVHSEEGRVQRKLKEMEKFEEARSKGEEAFRGRDYHSAMLYYSMALIVEPSNATLLSNRSLCWTRLETGHAALTDALACMKLRPGWPKAHYRAGAAWMILKEFNQAVEAFFEGLKLDPENKELRNAYQEAVEARLKSITINQST